jgi:hypothetical protein
MSVIDRIILSSIALGIWAWVLITEGTSITLGRQQLRINQG